MCWILQFNDLYCLLMIFVKTSKPVELQLTSRPASLLCRLTAARESCPPSSASTISFEIFSPNAALSLQPPQIHPLPPSRTTHCYPLPKINKPFHSFLRKSTWLSDSGVIAAAVVKVSHTAVFGECVHHPSGADGMDERCLLCGCKKCQRRRKLL